MYKVRGGNKQGNKVSIKCRSFEDLKLIKALHKVIKLPAYIVASASLLANSLTSDALGIGMSLALIVVVAILGNDIRFLKNFSSYLY